MKKFVIVASIAAFFGLASANAAEPYTAAQKDAIKLLLKNGYHDIYITGQGTKQCSSKKNDFDWEMQVFTGVSKEGHIVKGIVCNDNIYVKWITKENDPNS